MPKSVQVPLRFCVEFEPLPGLTLAQLRCIERALEDRAEVHDLVLEGHHLTYCVIGVDRDLTLTDQVDLIDWATEVTGICRIRVGVLSPNPEGPLNRTLGFFIACSADPARTALSLLYRARRISPQCYVEALGGIICQMS